MDVRIIAATNRDLKFLIDEGKFREDLFYRLNVISLEIPGLRERGEDIPLLAQHFLDNFATKNRKAIKGFTPKAMDHFIKYDWPGNVRELMNAVERGSVLTQSDYVDVEDLPAVIKPSRQGPEDLRDFNEIYEDMPLDQVERTFILKTLESADGNKSEASRRLGITRKTLHKKLKKYGVMP